MTEGLRLWLVIQALGFPDVSLGISGAFFVALIGSLLTAVPLSPAGLGLVEAGMVGVLVRRLRRAGEEATDDRDRRPRDQRVLVIVIGSILYVVSPIRAGRASTQPVELRPPRRDGGVARRAADGVRVAPSHRIRTTPRTRHVDRTGPHPPDRLMRCYAPCGRTNG